MSTQMTLRSLRIDVLGITQATFAANLGVSRRTYIRYEMGGSAPMPVLKLATEIMKKKLRKEKR